MSRDGVNGMRRFWEEAFNGRDVSLLDDLIADDYVNHAALPGTPPGPAGQAAVLERLWAALPDARFEITQLAVDGDVVICIGTMSGTRVPRRRLPRRSSRSRTCRLRTARATRHSVGRRLSAPRPRRRRTSARR